jgi:hypothetical protein
MQEYAIQKSSRRCYDSDRILAPGERYYSAIIQKGSELVRRDYSAEKWNGPSAETLGWWVARIPDKKNAKTKLAPTQILFDTLQSFLETPGKDQIAYLLAVLLLRKKVLVSQDTHESSVDASPTSLDLSSTSGDQQFLVPVVEISSSESNCIQSELLELLYTED